MFFCEYSEISKNTYFEEHLQTAASVSCYRLFEKAVPHYYYLLDLLGYYLSIKNGVTPCHK